MTEDQVVQLLAGSGIAGGLVMLMGRIVMRVAERMIAAIDRVGVKIDDHTTKDLEHHADVREAVARMETRLDEQADWRERSTPVEGVPQTMHERRTPPRGYPAGEYAFKRPGTKGER